MPPTLLPCRPTLHSDKVVEPLDDVASSPDGSRTWAVKLRPSEAEGPRWPEVCYLLQQAGRASSTPAPRQRIVGLLRYKSCVFPEHLLRSKVSRNGRKREADNLVHSAGLKSEPRSPRVYVHFGGHCPKQGDLSRRSRGEVGWSVGRFSAQMRSESRHLVASYQTTAYATRHTFFWRLPIACSRDKH
ncbi:unnamed protein product, partial [Protopolystoma xenopodis]